MGTTSDVLQYMLSSNRKKNVLFSGFSMKSFVMIIDYCTVITVLIIIGKKWSKKKYAVLWFANEKFCYV